MEGVKRWEWRAWEGGQRGERGVKKWGEMREMDGRDDRKDRGEQSGMLEGLKAGCALGLVDFVTYNN